MILGECGGFGKCRSLMNAWKAMFKRAPDQVLPTYRPEPLPAARLKFLTISQITARWGVSAPTVLRLIEEGQLTGLKIRGIYRVTRESVESYERKVAF